MGKIEWLARPGTTGKTWNPITGCSPAGHGCVHCWARRMAKRLKGRCGYPADNPFRVTFYPERLDQPLHWKKPCTIFPVSMGDLFHEDVPFEYIMSALNKMLTATQHTYILLTKRVERMQRFFSSIVWQSPEHIWLCASASTQDEVDAAMPHLLNTPAAVRGLSLEPLLSAVDLSGPFGSVGLGPSGPWMRGLDWVIIGAEQHPPGKVGRLDLFCNEFPRERQISVWQRRAADIVSQYRAAGVAVFVKQIPLWIDGKAVLCKDIERFPKALRVRGWPA